ncbi:hypothetical protein TNCV_221331 [Trichonephila clavipes]|nr:hypothetical protein TNCV_221331 [Trichonephila clavipes]
MSLSSGQSEARPPVLKSLSKFRTHLSTHCSRDEMLSRPCPTRRDLIRTSFEKFDTQVESCGSLRGRMGKGYCVWRRGLLDPGEYGRNVPCVLESAELFWAEGNGMASVRDRPQGVVGLAITTESPASQKEVVGNSNRDLSAEVAFLRYYYPEASRPLSVTLIQNFFTVVVWKIVFMPLLFSSIKRP